ncbi:hypothetical protein BCR34DRAFT_188905 [Clohesyomyces aquaticus]|uniref:Uncharacterized protein n=1 Tax=Clohesyomyces aquaticus TaxID=1231657 RepID=A0A1Y1ZXZ6_9PLEO|nr:hypothetical protein BCR34DRAFT_188905 [Clohesyomyces aquaticus]
MNIFPLRNLRRTGANASVPAAPASSTSSSAQRVPKASRNPKFKWLSYFSKPIIASLVYFVTLYVSASAPFRHTFLGRVSAPLGNWFLTILAKAGDISFAFAVEDTIDTLTWRRLKERTKIAGSGNFNGIRLEWFLALMSTTGVEGLFGVLKKSTRHGLLKNTAGRWSFIRLAFILVLIPGPGIILMASVPQRDVIFPVRTVDVSGGVAMYDPRLATTYRPVAGIYAWRYVQTMLQDRALSWPVDPVSEACKSNKTCKSYLLAGSSETVGPWPFSIEAKGIDSFRLRDAPVYQIELWEPVPDTLVFSESRDCSLYGGLDPKRDYSMEVCIALQSTDGVLAAGEEPSILTS